MVGAVIDLVAVALLSFTTPSTIFSDLALASTFSEAMVHTPVPFFTTLLPLIEPEKLKLTFFPPMVRVLVLEP